jgi:hypothetical protein
MHLRRRRRAKLPKAERYLPEWQAAGAALIMAAEGRGPLMHARVGMLRVLNRNVERMFRPRRSRHYFFLASGPFASHDRPLGAT